MWFNSNDLTFKTPIELNDLHGYVLPHAGTKYTKNIINHTLRFKPSKNFKYVKIIYYPSSDKPNINGIWYHEYYVIWKILEHYINKFWKLKNIKFIPINLKSKNNITRKKKTINISDNQNTITVVSADFSHFLPLQEAIQKENCAAKSILHKNFIPDCCDVIDDAISFKYLYKNIPNNWVLQWIGRTRSPGLKGVGYLSFLIRNKPTPNKINPDGLFVTVYDNNMNAHECLGQWFKQQKWNKYDETVFINNVIQKAASSRLTNGKLHNQKMAYYTITYLYKSNSNRFIRGWHGVLNNAFFLSDVFLENTYENGSWIKDTDITWPKFNSFNFSETNKKLSLKSNAKTDNNYIFYNTAVIHKKIN